MEMGLEGLEVWHHMMTEPEREQAIKMAYEKNLYNLINDIRKGYGKDMPIIWAYDPDEGVPDYIKEVLDSFGGESAGLYILELEQLD